MSGAISIFCGCTALCLVYAIMVFSSSHVLIHFDSAIALSTEKADFMQDQFIMSATLQQTKTVKLIFVLLSQVYFANMTSSISIALIFCLIKAHIHRNL